MDKVKIALNFLFAMELNWDPEVHFDYEGPFGRRNFRRVTAGGKVKGGIFDGHIADASTTDWGRKSVDGTLTEIDALITLRTDADDVVLMQVRGRMSDVYGPGESRLQIMMHAADGPLDHLNRRQAFGIGRTVDGVHHVDVFTIGEVLDPDAVLEEGTHSITASLAMTRKSNSDPDKHPIIVNQLGGRYLSVAAGGGKFLGADFNGEFVRGFSWTPHRYSLRDDVLLMHYDADTLVMSEDGVPLLMSYTGVTSPGSYPDRSWRTVLVFEAPVDSDLASFNAYVGIGVGRWVGDGAQYHVYLVD